MPYAIVSPFHFDYGYVALDILVIVVVNNGLNTIFNIKLGYQANHIGIVFTFQGYRCISKLVYLVSFEAVQ